MQNHGKYIIDGDSELDAQVSCDSGNLILIRLFNVYIDSIRKYEIYYWKWQAHARKVSKLPSTTSAMRILVTTAALQTF